MIPFENTWPYDIIGDDFYVPECPFCKQENVLIPLQKEEVYHIQTGLKKLLVFPCCFAKIKLLQIDDDYLLADQKLRQL